MEVRPLVKAFHLKDPPTAAMFTYIALSALCGVIAPEVAAIEEITRALGPATVLALVAAKPELRALETLIPLLLAGAVVAASATGYGFHKQTSSKRALSPVDPVKVCAMGAGCLTISALFVLMPLYAVSFDATTSSRAQGIKAIMSFSVLTSTVFYAMCFWAAQFLAVLAALCFRRAARAA